MVTVTGSTGVHVKMNNKAVTYCGTVPTFADLPETAKMRDSYIVLADSVLYVYLGSAGWVDADTL